MYLYLRISEWICWSGADIMPKHGGDDAVGTATVSSHGEHNDLSREDCRIREAAVGGGIGKCDLHN